MAKRYRAFWSFIIMGSLALGGLILPQSALFAGKTANPSLDKTAVKPDTPYIVLGMGCFWGSEKRMQALKGVLDVEAGYAGGDIENPSYETLHDTEAQINNGKAIKNHAEVVKVFYDAKQTTLEQVLIQFWENHDPTQVNRQGNDIGSNYRSAVFYRNEDEQRLAEKTRDIYQANLKTTGINETITTEITPLKHYTPAESYHQDYLEKNPLGYCGLGGTGVAYVDPVLGEKGPHSSPLTAKASETENWDKVILNEKQQLIAFETPECGYCRQFDKEVLANWKHPIPIHATNVNQPPPGWKLQQTLFATPTIVFFENKQEITRYTGYQGADKFWQWLQSVVTN
ncbi:MAG: peptide-methionine (S)-S-oxide reductase MsrA [Gammaproteobacteria bacterium]|nr:peptide-methionine (S)-S-oxide reductase MsrA [Gammaproteobacteria bacterium]